MPKIKDLGITVVPEQFRPPEIGGGGGCGYTFCTDCTTQPYSICGTTPGTYQDARATCAPVTCGNCTVVAYSRFCTDCTTQAFSICGTTPGTAQQAAVGAPAPGGCSDCTTQAFSICGTTGCAQSFCTDCTTQAFSICGTTRGAGTCTDCTTQAFSICGTTGCGQSFCTDCTTRPFSFCGTTRITGTVACRLQSRFPTILDVTTPCGGSFVGPETIRQGGGGLRIEDINQLRAQINEQLKALDELEKSLGPQSLDEVEAREKQLTEELAKMKALRTELGKKK